MNRRLLAVMPESINYISGLDVSAASSFEEAMGLIEQAERAGAPFDALDLSVRDRRAFDRFIRWMADTGRKYPFSIFGYGSDREFMRIRDFAQKNGFHFND